MGVTGQLRQAMQDELSESIESTLLEHARRNELKIAYARIVAIGLGFVLDLSAACRPMWVLGVPYFPFAKVVIDLLWLLPAIALMLVLRRGWYRPWLRSAMPVADGLVVLSAFISLWIGIGPAYLASPANGAIAAEVCALVAVSGGLRLTRQAAVLAAIVAAIDFVIVARLAETPWAQVMYVYSLLLAVGLLSVWMTDVVRLAMASEVGQATLRRFLPKPVVDAAYQDPMDLIVQPRRVDATVVVSDLRNFTAFAETLSPEQVLSFLNEVQGTCARIVADHGGMVDKFMGDGMLAVFGAIEPLENHAAQALAAVTEMVAAVRLISDRRSAAGAAAVRLGIGVHSGPMVVGCLGSGARLEFTIIGDTVNVTSRLESLTKEAGVDVLVSDVTAQAVQGGPLKPIGAFPIRGRQEPLAVHTLVV